MRTKLGDYLRKLRLQNSEILKDMAEKLEVSSAFLSAVENGKKKMPEKWIDQISALYNLSESQISELKDAVLASSNVIELNLENSNEANRDLAVLFARQFDSLDDETSSSIYKILNKKR